MEIKSKMFIFGLNTIILFSYVNYHNAIVEDLKTVTYVLRPEVT